MSGSAVFVDLASVATAANLTAVKAKTDLLPASPANEATLAGLALQSTTQETGADTQTAGATVYQLIASSAAAIRRITFSGTISYASGTETIEIFILTGPGGSEVTRARGRYVTHVSPPDIPFFLTVQVNLPAGTRVAWKYTTDFGTQSISFGYVVEEP